MIKSWFIGNLNITIKWQRGYWRWSVGKYGSPKEQTGKHKEQGTALSDALDALSRLSPAHIVKKEESDLSFQAHDDATSHGCQMCGNEWKSLNTEGYCSSCWTVWNS